MSQLTLAEARAKVDSLLDRIEPLDEDSFDRHGAYAENFWNDLPSLLDLIDWLREDLADLRRGYASEVRFRNRA